MLIVPCSHSFLNNLYNEHYTPMSLSMVFYDWIYKEYRCMIEYSSHDSNGGWILNFEDEADAIMFKLRFGL